MLTKLKSTLKNSLFMLCDMIAQNHGIPVVVEGNRAYTDGRKVFLPLFDVAKYGVNAIIGYLLHEVAHVRYTDFSVAKKLNFNHAQFQMLNILEDVRIETLMEAYFPGAKAYFEAMMRQIALDLKGFDAPTEYDKDKHSMPILFGYVNVLVNARYLKRQVCVKVLPQWERVARDVLPAGFFPRLDALLSKFMLPDSTYDTAQLANLILAAFANEKEKEQPEGTKPNGESPEGGKPNESGESGDVSDTEQPSEDGESTEGGDTESNDAPEDGNDGGKPSGDTSDETEGQTPTEGGRPSNSSNTDSGDASDSGDGSDEESDGNDMSTEISNEIGGYGFASEQELQDALNDLMSEVDPETLDVAGSSQIQKDIEQEGIDVYNTDYFQEESYREKRPYDDQFITEALQRSGALRARLMTLVNERNRTRKSHGPMGARVSGKRAAHMYTGSQDLFVKKRKQVSPNTAVHLLVDTSSSMYGHAQPVANQASASIGVALSSLKGTSVAVSHFPGANSHVSNMIARGNNIQQVIHQCNLGSSGGTPMAEAMRYAMDELNEAPEPRKILIVITDDGANDPVVVKYLNSQADVISMSVCIGRDYTSHLFDYSVTIENINELQDKLFDLVTQVV